MSVMQVSELANFNFEVAGNSTSTREECLAAAIANHQQKFYRIAFRMLRNAQDAQDALQDALLLAFRNLSQFKGKAQMTTWLTAIVMNSARMYIRRRCTCSTQSFRQIEGETDSFVDNRPDPEKIYGQAELQRKLHSASKRLSPNVRGAFQLVVLRGMSIREAAQTLGVSIGTIKARVFRGRKQVLHMMRTSTYQRTARKPSAISDRRVQALRELTWHTPKFRHGLGDSEGI